MIQQLAVYDEHGTQIGMTFPKRARQLVSKQRAHWHDDDHTAIRLLPDSKEDAPMEYIDDTPDDTADFARSDDLLLYLAKKNVQEKRNLTRHIIAYALAWPMIAMFYEAIISNTRHPQYWLMRNALRSLDNAANFLPTARAENIEQSILAFYNSLMHPMLYLIIGFMIAWSVWIIARVIKRVTMLKGRRVSKAKPDPVQVEYQRLKDMGAVKF